MQSYIAPPPDAGHDATPVNSRGKVLVASLVGTAIEFFDFYIYATAAVIVFPHIFFPQGDATVATLQSLVTFAIAFIARPIGSALFGHFGDRASRKVTLVASLLTMGISTVVIGLLPGYQSIGVFAPLLLALARFGQGLGLGGEWGCGTAGDRKCASQKTGALRLFPSAGRTNRFLLCQRHLSAALLAVKRKSVYAVGLARAVYSLCGAGAHWPVCPRHAE